jgi:hypothetical protein
MKKILSLLLFISLVLFIYSCSEDDEKISGQQSAAVEDQSAADGYFNDAGDLSASAFNAPTAADISGRTTGGRQVTVTVTGDNRFTGATVTLVTPDNNVPYNPQGTITIDFGTGTTDGNGVVRKGKIIVNYKGLRFVLNSTVDITFDGYQVNGVKIEGKRSLKNLSTISTAGMSFEVKDTGGKITFSDGTFITREATHTHQWKFGTTLADYQWVVEGTANGQTREKQTYIAATTKALVFKANCVASKNFIPAEGTLLLTVDLVPIQIDYGTGTCDNVVKITLNGFSKEVTVGS